MVLWVLSNLRHSMILSDKFHVNLLIQLYTACTAVGFGFFRTRDTQNTAGNGELMSTCVM